MSHTALEHPGEKGLTAECSTCHARFDSRSELAAHTAATHVRLLLPPEDAPHRPMSIVSGGTTEGTSLGALPIAPKRKPPEGPAEPDPQLR